MKIYKDFPLSQILYYKIGGKAKYLLEASSVADVKEAVEFIQKQGISKVLFVGSGSNILASDDGFDGAVLRLLPGDENDIKDLGDGKIEVFAGVNLGNVIKFAFDKGYVGLEWAGGLPGKVGAAVRGNVGAFGGEIKDNIEKVEILEIEPEGFKVKDLGLSELSFSYRTSIIKRNKNLIVLSATFKLKKVSLEELAKAKEIYESNIEYRRSHHPLEFSNCGSVFKNIDEKEEVEKILKVWPDIKELVENKWHGKVSMGYIIDRLGLTGFKEGDAQISIKHSNFIVNLGNAKFSDVLGIIEMVKQKVNETLNFVPEVEVEIVN